MLMVVERVCPVECGDLLVLRVPAAVELMLTLAMVMCCMTLQLLHLTVWYMVHRASRMVALLFPPCAGVVLLLLTRLLLRHVVPCMYGLCW